MTDKRVDDWELVESEQLADYRITRVRRDRRRSPRTGAEHDFIVLQMREWVNVIAVTRQARIVIIEQYRHGTQEVGVEIPGGVVDPGDSELEQAARRELLEETGYEAEEFVCIGKVTANPAIQDNRCHTFVALGAHAVGEARLEAGEDIAVGEVGIDEVGELIASGRMSHALVIAGFWWFDRWRGEHEEVLQKYLD
ncbi:MAG: NUDIX hydrolase [Candidatus Latescibacterota bacterium]|nr:NUDIX hydrolase [Candidatus Latescibacterota bacterium]